MEEGYAVSSCRAFSFCALSGYRFSGLLVVDDCGHREHKADCDCAVRYSLDCCTTGSRIEEERGKGASCWGAAMDSRWTAEIRSEKLYPSFG